jgi:hypothetical protein
MLLSDFRLERDERKQVVNIESLRQETTFESKTQNFNQRSIKIYQKVFTQNLPGLMRVQDIENQLKHFLSHHAALVDRVHHIIHQRAQ